MPTCGHQLSSSATDSLFLLPSAVVACSFIYVETAFLWRWYLQQDEQMIATLENLVNEGRLEFIGGGWSMNDEACVHYNAVVDQMSLGMRWEEERREREKERLRGSWREAERGWDREKESDPRQSGKMQMAEPLQAVNRVVLFIHIRI